MAVKPNCPTGVIGPARYRKASQGSKPSRQVAHIHAGSKRTIRSHAGATTGARITPPQGTFHAISTNGYGACGIRADGSLHCWGYAYRSGTRPPGGTFTDVSVHYHSCGVRSDGEILCWNHRDGSNEGMSVPPDGPFQAVLAGRMNCGVRIGGGLDCWAAYEDEVITDTPQTPQGNFSYIAGAGDDICGIRPDGTLECWGYDFSGENSPPTGQFISVAAGGEHACGVKTDGSILCWGVTTMARQARRMGRFCQSW